MNCWIKRRSPDRSFGLHAASPNLGSERTCGGVSLAPDDCNAGLCRPWTLRLDGIRSSKPKLWASADQHGAQIRLKAVSSFLLLVFWISSWFPASLDRWAVFAAAICVLGLLLALLAQRSLNEYRWPAKALSVLAVFVVIGGAFLAFAALALGTPVDGAIALFFVVGLAGYLHMIANILAPGHTLVWFLGIGPLVLFLLASWSWASALGMYVHLGASGNTDEACILVPRPVSYETELSSIWEMRLPEVATSRTGPTGTVILDYHAILVAPSEDETQVYNWSKRRMRFDALDKKLNPYLPTICP